MSLYHLAVILSPKASPSAEFALAGANKVKSFFARNLFRAEKYRSLRKEFFFSQVALATKNSFRSAASSIKSPAKRVLIEIK